MRGIATRAQVSLGSAYYYFDSKDDLVMAFYERASEEMGSRIEAALATATDFEQRVAAIVNAKFEYFRPDRAFLGALFRHAADPQNRLSPFSAETRHIRERDQAYFGAAITAEPGGISIPEDLAAHLPKMLWLYQMGLILYWIYDRSHEQRHTHVLAEKSLALLVGSLKMASFTLLKPLRSKIVELLVLSEEGDEHA